MSKKQDIVPLEVIERRIYVIRGQKVMLDQDLAEFYGVTTGRLNEQVKRNISRFPEDFAFQLTTEEFEILRSQSASSSWGGRRYPPRAFTEHGILMLSGVLNSDQAVEVNISIVRTFVRLREMMATHKELAKKLEEHDQQIAYLFELVRQLSQPPADDVKPVGFIWSDDEL